MNNLTGQIQKSKDISDKLTTYDKAENEYLNYL